VDLPSRIEFNVNISPTVADFLSLEGESRRRSRPLIVQREKSTTGRSIARRAVLNRLLNPIPVGIAQTRVVSPCGACLLLSPMSSRARNVQKCITSALKLHRNQSTPTFLYHEDT